MNFRERSQLKRSLGMKVLGLGGSDRYCRRVLLTLEIKFINSILRIVDFKIKIHQAWQGTARMKF